MKPTIRVATTAEGNIEATIGLGIAHRWMLVDRRTGEVLITNTKEGSNAYRWLVQAAREHVAL